MTDSSAQSTQLHRWLERIRAGDLTARDEMLRTVCGRLERLAHKMLRRFPDVQRWVETGDVLQNALLRLLRALQDVQPASMRDFFGLAAEQMRRELLDLARHYYGPHGVGCHHASHGATAAPEPPERNDDPDELERWCAFHEEVANLPATEREVVGLVFYHGWTQADVAEHLQVSVRTVKRHWQAALIKLHRLLQELAPET